jgi:ankyrin repeat protein
MVKHKHFNNMLEKKADNIEEGVANAGNYQYIHDWLEAGNNPNAWDSAGWSPLLKASARGNHEVVDLLLNNPFCKADPAMEHKISKALPIHFAGHSGSVETARALLEKRPDHLNAVWDLNGHTILLQAAFYGHLQLAEFLVNAGADTSLTTARGLGPMEMAKQFQNEALIRILQPFDTPAEKKAENYQKYLQRIAPIIPEEEKPAQALSDQLVQTIMSGISGAFSEKEVVGITLEKVKHLVENDRADVNRLGGPLQQPPLIAVVTGNNGFPTNKNVEQLRNSLALFLLEKGADPTLHEIHPMGAQTIIRACVFNHLDILKMCGRYLTKTQLADALNEIPIVNGLTALHDTVLRATMADAEFFEKYLDQTRWCVENGARSDIEDFSGRTQKNIAENAKNELYKKRLLEVL